MTDYKKLSEQLETQVKQLTTEINKQKTLTFHAQRFEAIGRLAGGIAHDFNNWLTIITGYSDLVDLHVKDERIKQDIGEVRHASWQAAKLVSQLLALASRQILKPKVVNLNKVFYSIENLLQRTIGENINLILELEDKLENVLVDPVQFEQIVLNLVINAKDAMPNGGILTICTTNDHQFVILAVKDTGCGIDKKNIPHIFDPFFTTKSAGKGTGLGLSTVLGIVKQSKGNVEVWSEKGKGTRFYIKFPAVKLDSNYNQKTDSGTNVEINGMGTILVVEDEPQIRRLLNRTLTRLGYNVLLGKNVEDAMAIFDQHKPVDPVDLVLTDVIMTSQLTGKDLAEYVSPTDVIYMSGHTDNVIMEHGVLEDGVHFLQKPFTTEELGLAIKEVMKDTT